METQAVKERAQRDHIVRSNAVVLMQIDVLTMFAMSFKSGTTAGLQAPVYARGREIFSNRSTCRAPHREE